MFNGDTAVPSSGQIIYNNWLMNLEMHKLVYKYTVNTDNRLKKFEYYKY